MRRYLVAWPAGCFVLLAWGWTWLMVLPVLAAARGWTRPLAGAGVWEALGALGPLLAALVVLQVTGGRTGLRKLWRELLHWRVGGFWLAFTLLSPCAILLAAVCWQYLAENRWPDPRLLAAAEFGTWAGVLHLVIIRSLLQGLGEEPGWRGCLLPLLRARHGPLLATLILWPFWLLWHLPYFLSRPEFGLVQFAGFSLGILSAAVWLTLIREGTHSVLMAVAWHALINLTRFIALALSPALFLKFSLLVTVGALPIVIGWLLAGRRRPEDPRPGR